MTTQATATYNKQLLEQRAGLLAQLSFLRGGPVGRVEASIDHFGQLDDARAQVNTARDLEFALDEHETQELRLIDAALRRIEAGTYGQCVDCGVIIPEARQHAAPEAIRCINCQAQAESSAGNALLS